MRKILALLLALLPGSALAADTLPQLITNAPPIQLPYQSSDYVPVVRGNVTYHVPANVNLGVAFPAPWAATLETITMSPGVTLSGVSIQDPTNAASSLLQITTQSHILIGNPAETVPNLTCDSTQSMTLCIPLGPLIRVHGDLLVGDVGNFGAASATGAQTQAVYGTVASGGWKSFVTLTPAEINYTSRDGGKGGPGIEMWGDQSSCCGTSTKVADSITAIALRGSGYAVDDIITLDGGTIDSAPTVTGTTNSTTAVSALSANVLKGP